MGRSNENQIKAKKKGYKLTKNQLANWKLKYHKLIFGKPSYDFFVDDKAIGFSKKWTKNLEKFIPLKKVGKPEDISNASMFLLSDQANYITGIELVVDGGITSKP